MSENNFDKIKEDNQLLREKVINFNQDKNTDNLNALIAELVKCTVLVPGVILNKDGVDIQVPVTIKDKEGRLIQPCFTSLDIMTKGPKPDIIIGAKVTRLLDLIISQKDKVKGLVIDPGDSGVVLAIELLCRIQEFEKQRVQNEKAIDNNQPHFAKLKLTDDKGKEYKIEDIDGDSLPDDTYSLLQRLRFEYERFPDRFYQSPNEFMEQLIEGREDFLDSVYEESFDNIRRYPFLADEFKIMLINMDELKIASISMPERYLAFDCLESVYLLNDSAKNIGRYFGIMKEDKGNGVKRFLLEINSDKKVIIIGEAPDEGNEINFILYYIKEH